jgi:hypothetical protein
MILVSDNEQSLSTSRAAASRAIQRLLWINAVLFFVVMTIKELL